MLLSCCKIKTAKAYFKNQSDVLYCVCNEVVEHHFSKHEKPIKLTIKHLVVFSVRKVLVSVYENSSDELLLLSHWCVIYV